jgi:hypothetical protein
MSLGADVNRSPTSVAPAIGVGMFVLNGSLRHAYTSFEPDIAQQLEVTGRLVADCPLASIRGLVFRAVVVSMVL